MKTFDRLGVHVEQCESCKGIFLDYGELEQIVAAEQRQDPNPPPLDYGGRPGGDRYDRPDDRYADRRGYRPDSPGGYRRSDSPGPFGGFGGGGYGDSPGPYGRRRRKGFLEQLFD